MIGSEIAEAAPLLVVKVRSVGRIVALDVDVPFHQHLYTHPPAAPAASPQPRHDLRSPLAILYSLINSTNIWSVHPNYSALEKASAVFATYPNGLGTADSLA